MHEPELRYTDEGQVHGTGQREGELHGLYRLNELSDWDIVDGYDIRGWAVFDQSDDKFAEVQDLIVDVKSGDVELAVISYGGTLGMGGEETAIPIEHLHLDEEDKHVKIDCTKEDLENAPRHEKDTRDYEQFHNYWGGRTSTHGGERREHEGEYEHHRAEDHKIVVPETEEHLVTGKRTEQVGEVEVRKEVETIPETAHETLRKTRVRVSHRPASEHKAYGDERELHEGESVTIPVEEEQMVVGKEQRVTGEVVVEPEMIEEEAKETHEVRREHVEVEQHGEAEYEEEEERARRE